MYTLSLVNNNDFSKYLQLYIATTYMKTGANTQAMFAVIL